jgi:hypothetical protein
MSELNKIPDRPNEVKMVDIRDTLNANGGSVTDNLITFFRPDANLAAFSRRKPHVNTRKPVIGYMETSDMAKTTLADGRVIRRYGLEMLGGLKNPSAVYVEVRDNGGLGYRYPLPTGGQSQPYRLTDFCGYNPKAKVPLDTTFGNGYTFAYVSTDYVLAGRELKAGSDNSQLYREDIYPTEDVDGNAKDMRRGVCIKTDTDEMVFVGGMNFLTGNYLTNPLSKLAGKTFEIFEFITDAPYGWSTEAEHSDWIASGYYCYALPMPLVTCSMQSSVGPAPTYEVAKCVITSIPRFFGLSGTDYSTVKAAFKISSDGDLYNGGDVELISCGIYRDSECTDIIQRQVFDDITLGADQETDDYNVTLYNSTGLSGIYFGVWFNGKLQYSGMVASQVATTVSE